METISSGQLCVPLFGGQGSLVLDRAISIKDRHSLISSPSAAFLLSSCYAAFRAELNSLDPHFRDIVGICASDFCTKTSIIWPNDEKQYRNPAFTWPALLLLQLLLYLSFAERHSLTAGPDSLFVNVLRGNSENKIGVLGFSSGLLSACVVATSSSSLSFVNRAVEAYRLAFWIGVRSQIYRAERSTCGDANRPWAMVAIGIDEVGLQYLIDRFNGLYGTDLVSLTAVISDNVLTVSGHPDDLTAFMETVPKDVVFHETNVFALYHCRRLRRVRDEVCADAVSRNIDFPAFRDILFPIRSTLSGDIMSKAAKSSQSLLQQIMDMVLIHPVNWSPMVNQMASKLPSGFLVTLLNIDLGAGMVNSVEKAIAASSPTPFKTLDLSIIESPVGRGSGQERIAIVGMAVNMPGAKSVEELWEVLINGKNTVSEIPEQRFDLTHYTNANHPGRSMKTQTGNFVHDIDQFDHKFFNISPREARSMDPQQRMLLQVAYHALEDAGYVPHSTPTFDPETFGCFIGASTHDYVHNLRNDIDVYYSTGTLSAFLSGRLSYCLGLSGPSIVFDTACSSSMVALHQACRGLMNRDCRAALAGGVNVITSPDMFIGLDRGHFLSHSGQCKPFDASANGYARGEGCGVFILKCLSDALAEDDQILGIIRGIEINQSGKASSITHPHAPTQEALFKQLLMKSDIDSNSVNVVEAHGTGTQAGDINEMESIRSVLAADRTPDNPLYVTSIKANIGHLEAASGSASLVKVLMMLKHQIIPKQIGIQALNPGIAPLILDNTVISRENVTWTHSPKSYARLALVNNFGAAGSNAAMLVEEFIPPSPLSTVGASCVFGLSAKDELSLEELRSKYMVWLRSISSNLDISLLDVAYTTTARRQLYPYRLAVPCCDFQQLISKLEATAITKVEECASDVVFVFSGQGNQYHGMAASLYATSRTFKKDIDECNSILTTHGFQDIRFIFSRGVDNTKFLNDQEVLQSATFSLQYALANLWVSWGVKPKAVVGHSLGEYAALVIAGVLSLKDGLLVVATRARLMFQRLPPMMTGMVAVSAEPAKVDVILASNRFFSNVSISCFNSPRHCALSGPLRELDELTVYLEKEKGFKVTRLQVPFGYHSSSMSPLASDLTALGARTRSHPNRLAVISTVLGRVIMPGDPSFASQDYFARQCIEPVNFTKAIGSYLSNSVSSGTTTWLEISPHPSISPMLRSFPVLSDAVILGSLRMNEDSWTSLSKALNSFYLGCYSVDWRRVFSDLGPTKCVKLPMYPFSTQAFWIPFAEEISKPLVLAARIKNIESCGKAATTFTTTIDQLRHYIKGHRVGDVPLCPASVYLDLAARAIRLAFQSEASEDEVEFILRQIKFSQPLTCVEEEEEEKLELTVVVDIPNRTFEVKSKSSSPVMESMHAYGCFHPLSRSELRKYLDSLLMLSMQAQEAVLGGGNRQETFTTRTIYQVIFPRVVEYSSEFRTLESISLSLDGLEAVGIMNMPDPCDTGEFFNHPLFLDTLIHIAGFIANVRGEKNDAFICNGIDGVELVSSAVGKGGSFILYSKISLIDNGSCYVGETLALSNNETKTLLARVKGILFQRVRLNSFKAGLASLTKFRSQELTYETVPETPVTSSHSHITTTVMKLVANACGIEPADLSLYESFDSLGIDSLMGIELSYDLSMVFPSFGCRPQELAKCRNIKDIVLAISSVVNPSSIQELSEDVQASPLSTWSTPTTLVHSPSTPSIVRRVVAHVLDVEESTIDDDTRLSALGLDSLASIETVHALRKECHLNVPLNFLTSSETITDLESRIFGLNPSISLLQDHAQVNKTFSRHPLDACQGFHCKSLSLLQHSNSEGTPLVLIHDGSGMAISYERLSNLRRCVWSISNPRIASSAPWDSLPEMARVYARLIADEMEGPVIVGGWSFGGVVAFEVGRQLEARSMVVKGILLLDSPSPLLHVPMTPAFIEHVLDDMGIFGTDLRLLCTNQFIINAQLLANYTPDPRNKEKHPVIFLSCKEPYNPPECQNVPAWFSDRRNMASAARGWDVIVGCSPDILEIPGHHFAPFSTENVTAVSDRIFDACNKFDSPNIKSIK